MTQTTHRTTHRLRIDAPGARIFHVPELRAEFRQLGLEFPLLRLDGGWGIPGLVQQTIEEYSRRELQALRLSCERLARLLLQHSINSTAPPAGPRAGAG